MLLDEKLDVIITFEQTIYEIENAKEMLDILYYTTVSANLTVSKKHPRYSRDAVPADFEDETCYVASAFFVGRADVESFQREWKKYGLTIHDVRTSPNRDSMKTMVELGAGFTICTDLDAFTQTKGIATLPLNRKQELYLSWRKAENRTPVLGLLDELTQLCIR